MIKRILICFVVLILLGTVSLQTPVLGIPRLVESGSTGGPNLNNIAPPIMPEFITPFSEWNTPKDRWI